MQENPELADIKKKLEHCIILAKKVNREFDFLLHGPKEEPECIYGLSSDCEMCGTDGKCTMAWVDGIVLDEHGECTGYCYDPSY